MDVHSRFRRSDGYVIVRVAGRGSLAYEHRSVWEENHGPVPAGMDVHHKNTDKADNRPENLELRGKSEHGRLHGGGCQGPIDRGIIST